MSGDPLDAFLAAIGGALRPPGPDEITAERFAKGAGLQRCHATRRLNQLVLDGVAIRRDCVVNGRRAFCWKML